MFEKQILRLRQVIESCVSVDKGLPLQYIKCLLLVYEEEGISVSELAERSRLGTSSTSRIVHSLAEHRQNGNGYHFIKVVKDQNNARKRQLIMTKKGKDFVETLLNCL